MVHAVCSSSYRGVAALAVALVIFRRSWTASSREALVEELVELE